MLLEIYPEAPEPRKIRRAVEALLAGEVIAYPTDTVYGLGCDLFNKKAIEKLCQMKGVPITVPLAFVCSDLSDIATYAIVENPQYRLLKRYTPGPYCFILQATREVPKLVLSKRKTVGIRVPNNAVALAITRELGRPIISSSAQIQGEDPFIDAREIQDAFPQVALAIDAGAGGIIPTTVVDLTTGAPSVVRQGLGPVDEFL